jgi:transcriptional regulator with XRE-family HTH domain
MHIVQKIENELKRKSISKRKMLIDLGLNHNLLNDWKSRGSEPSAVKLGLIAQYLGVPTDYLLGLKELTEQDRLNLEIAKLTPGKRKQAEQFVEFLKTQEEFAKDVEKALNTPPPKLQTE